MFISGLIMWMISGYVVFWSLNRHVNPNYELLTDELLPYTKDGSPVVGFKELHPSRAGEIAVHITMESGLSYVLHGSYDWLWDADGGPVNGWQVTAQESNARGEVVDEQVLASGPDFAFVVEQLIGGGV